MNELGYKQFITQKDEFYTKFENMLDNPMALEALKKNLTTHLDLCFSTYPYYGKNKTLSYVTGLSTLLIKKRLRIKYIIMAVEEAMAAFEEAPSIAQLINLHDLAARNHGDEIKSVPCELCQRSGVFTLDFKNGQSVAFKCECANAPQSDTYQPFNWKWYAEVKDNFRNYSVLETWHKIQGREVDLRIKNFATPEVDAVYQSLKSGNFPVDFLNQE
jgi:hypothetical protein